MKLSDVMAELAKLGSPADKTLGLKHGAKEPFFGVKIGDLKPFAKKLKGQQALAPARKLGKVEVDVGDTDCRIPDAESYIMKSHRGASIAPKRKTVRC